MNSFIPWIGGKRLLRKQISAMIPEDIKSYVEVFGGAAWVLFYRDKYAPTEIYNDYDGNLVNLFRCVKYHAPELQRELSGMLNSRELFFDWREQLPARGLTDIQRAARFFFSIKTSFGADRRSFGCVKRNITVATAYMDAVAARLEGVVVEHKDFEDLIHVYDDPGALLYLDPPYHGTERHYDAMFREEDHRRLARVLRGVSGRFILSYNDDDFIRGLYNGFDITPVSRTNSLAAKTGDPSQFRELIIKNF